MISCKWTTLADGVFSYCETRAPPDEIRSKVNLALTSHFKKFYSTSWNCGHISLKVKDKKNF
jgi:hypothetical protein